MRVVPKWHEGRATAGAVLAKINMALNNKRGSGRPATHSFSMAGLHIRCIGWHCYDTQRKTLPPKHRAHPRKVFTTQGYFRPINTKYRGRRVLPPFGIVRQRHAVRHLGFGAAGPSVR